jgi:hypothetical protein
MKRLLFFCFALATLVPAFARAADRDDVYAEFSLGTSLNMSGRQRLNGIIGYLFRDDLGVGVGFEQLYSSNLKTADKAAIRGLMEFRWFQEPFEFSGDVGLANRQYRDASTKMQVSLGVTTAYLFALTPSLSAKADFSFLFIEEPRVIFSGALGARVLF